MFKEVILMNKKYKYFIFISFVLILSVFGCSIQDDKEHEEYINSIENITEHVESKQLQTSLSINPPNPDHAPKEIYVEGFGSYEDDIEVIETAIEHMDNLIADTNDVISKMNSLIPPEEYEKYHEFHIEALDSYINKIKKLRSFYSNERHSAIATNELVVEDQNQFAIPDMNEYMDKNEEIKTKIELSLNDLESRNNKFKSLIKDDDESNN